MPPYKRDSKTEVLSASPSLERSKRQHLRPVSLITNCLNVFFLGEGSFKATLNTGTFCNFDFVKANLAHGTFQVADARPPDKFHGTEPEPHPNFPSGHIKHAINLPYAQCLDPETKLMKTPEELKKVFEDAGIDLGKPLIVSCGSGMTACVVALASYLCGKRDTIVYDGSWMEWRQRASPDMIETNEPGPFRARF